MPIQSVRVRSAARGLGSRWEDSPVNLELSEPIMDFRGVWKGRPRILVVEDDEDLLLGLEWLLSREYDVRGVTSALAALGRCRQGWPDLLVVDYRLPDLDGVELLRTVRESSRIHSPALMISAYPDGEGRALKQGFDQFLSKPVSERRLRSAVERSLGL